MSLLFKIVYAAHANGTHHKLALDALRYMRCDSAEGWRAVFLKNAETYLTGSKAPDKTFKDFKNHVYHVRDNGWGGAPSKAREWFDKTVEALRAEDFETAVYNAGVLSHYYTDPIMPFHTAQSDAESVIHRAAEWSVAKSYGALRSQASEFASGMRVGMSTEADFVEAMVKDGAAHSNQYYESLIAHYDFDKGVVDPPAGFNEQGQNILSSLLVYAAVNFAQLLDRAIEEAAVSVPDVQLTAETVLAGLKIPVRWVTNKIENAEERKAIEAMYDELQQTGRVYKTLSEDDRTISDLYAKEVVRGRKTDQASQEMAEAQGAIEEVRKTIKVAARAVRETDQEITRRTSRRKVREDKYYLVLSDNVNDAPSIGKKTAERLSKVGIHSVADLLAADAEIASAGMDARHISADVIRSWQDQARLVCQLPKLRGTYAKVLVGAGFGNISVIAKEDSATLLTALDAYLKTPEGARALGSMREPDAEMVEAWVEGAIIAAEQKAA